MSYTEVTISGYNSSPPSDDGSQTASNQVTWAAIKTKLADPIKTALETVDDRVASAITTTDAYPATWAAADATVMSTLRGELNAASATAMVFYQAAAPTGWTAVAQNNKALRVVSAGGTGGTAGGTTAFTSVFTSRTIAQSNLPNVSWTHSLTAATHTHTGPSHTHTGPSHTHTGPSHTHSVSGETDFDGTHSHTYSNAGGTDTVDGAGGTNVSDTSSGSTSSDGSHDHTISLTTGAGGTGATGADGTGATGSGGTGATGASGSLAVSGTVSSGGSGTAMDFAVQYVDVIIATKN